MSESTLSAAQRAKRDLAMERFVAFLAPMFVQFIEQEGERKVICDIDSTWNIAEALADEGIRRATIRAKRDGN